MNELLKILNNNFDEKIIKKQSKIYVKLFDNNFHIIEIEKFETFIIHYNVVITKFRLIDEILIYQLKQKLLFFLRYFIVYFAKVHKYREFVQNFKDIIQHVKKLKTKRNENKSKLYSNFHSLTRKKKKQFNNIESCYKYHQSKHKINDKIFFCKRIS